MNSGGSGDWRSRGRREAMPKPVSQTWPVAELTRTLAGFTSLWMRPRWCNWPSAARKANGKAQEDPQLQSVARATDRAARRRGPQARAPCGPHGERGLAGELPSVGSSLPEANIRARAVSGFPGGDGLLPAKAPKPDVRIIDCAASPEKG